MRKSESQSLSTLPAVDTQLLHITVGGDAIGAIGALGADAARDAADRALRDDLARSMNQLQKNAGAMIAAAAR